MSLTRRLVLLTTTWVVAGMLAIRHAQGDTLIHLDGIIVVVVGVAVVMSVDWMLWRLRQELLEDLRDRHDDGIHCVK